MIWEIIDNLDDNLTKQIFQILLFYPIYYFNFNSLYFYDKFKILYVNFQ